MFTTHQHPAQSDRRGSERRRQLKGALIVFNNGHSTINGVLRNLSDTGALIKVPSTIGVPDIFELRISNAERRRCLVVRRSGTEIGVRFVAN
jgi:hypothetical protein